MTNGSLTPEQRRVLAKYVEGKPVYDLGAGELELSQELLKLGASEVFAIDKAPKPHLHPWPAKLHYEESYFHDLKKRRMETLFVSWPVNWDVNLFDLMLTAKTIIYLGKNTGGTACGVPGLFELMVRRELLAYVPHPKNCLIVTGAYLSTPRKPTGEEHAALTSFANYFEYEEAERLGL